MPLPPTHPISFTAGDVLKFAFQVMDKDLDNPGDPAEVRDLTGWEAASQVRQTPSSPDVIAEWAIEPLGTDGYIRMKILGSTTQDWAVIKTLVSDIQLTDPAGDPETILRLDISAAQDVTRE